MMRVLANLGKRTSSAGRWMLAAVPAIAFAGCAATHPTAKPGVSAKPFVWQPTPEEKHVIEVARKFVQAAMGPDASRMHPMTLGTSFDQKTQRWTSAFSAGFVDDYVTVELDKTATRGAVSTFTGPVLEGSSYASAMVLKTLPQFRAARAAQKRKSAWNFGRSNFLLANGLPNAVRRLARVS
jgi:hypothetical protein